MKQKTSKEDKDLVISGRNAVVEALESHKPVQRVIVQQGITGEMEVEIRNLCKREEVPYRISPKQELDRWTRTLHQGVVAILSPVRFYEPSDVVQQAFANGRTPLIIALDGVEDVRNFGAIGRSAEVLGADGIMFPAKGTAMINDFAIKASSGALLNLPLIRVRSLENALLELKANGLMIYGLEMHADDRIHEAELSRPVCLVLGSEGEGLRPHIMRLLDKSFSIEQAGQTESLNVSVAAGIVLYQTLLQRTKKK